MTRVSSEAGSGEHVQGPAQGRWRWPGLERAEGSGGLGVRKGIHVGGCLQRWSLTFSGSKAFDNQVKV